MTQDFGSFMVYGLLGSLSHHWYAPNEIRQHSQIIRMGDTFFKPFTAKTWLLLLLTNILALMMIIIWSYYMVLVITLLNRIYFTNTYGFRLEWCGPVVHFTPVMLRCGSAFLRPLLAFGSLPGLSCWYPRPSLYPTLLSSIFQDFPKKIKICY